MIESCLHILVYVVFCSFQGSPSEDRNFRSDVDDTETEETSFSGQEDSNDLLDILEWAKVQMSQLLDMAILVFLSCLSLKLCPGSPHDS